MPALLAALILAYFITKAIEAGASQARTEVRRLREEVARNVREVRGAAARAGQSPAGRTAARAARATWRGMQGARRGAGPYAQKMLAGTGPLRRIFRAAWAAGMASARAMRAARTPRPGQRSGGLSRPPRLGVCADCGHVAAATALIPAADGAARRICAQCAVQPDARAEDGTPVPEPEAPPVWDAEIVPDAEPAATAGPDAIPAPAPAWFAPPEPPPFPVLAVTVDEVPLIEPPPALNETPRETPGDDPATAPAATAPAGIPAITTGEPMTEIALPAGVGGTVNVTGGVAGGGGGDSRTHGLWLTAVAHQAALVEAGKQHLNAMAARLCSAAGGRTQIRDIYGWHREADAFITGLGDMVTAIDPGEQQFIAAIPGGDLDEMCEPHYYATGGAR